MVTKISTIVLGVTFLIAGILDCSDSATSEFLLPPNTGCACTGSVLTYTCTAIGTGNTLWTGTAFDCATNGIILRHERFTQSGGAVGECNNGAILGRSTAVDNSCYTSQIDVTVSATFNSKTIQCIHNSGMGINMIGTSVITVYEAPYPPPNGVRLTNISQDMLTFGWDSLGSNCESVLYGISSTCGSCGPTSTNATTVDCFDYLLSSDVSTCTFIVNLMLCGSTGPSSAVTVTLKVPDTPRAKITPVYSAANKSLLSIELALYQEDSFDIADGISGAVMNYNTYFSSGLPVVNSACENDVCDYAVDLPFSTCNSSAVVNMTVSATNMLGEGPPSDPVITDCTNQFVEIQYSSATSTISCIFLSEPDSSEKSCSIWYGECNQELTEMAAGNTTTSNVIMLNLALTSSDSQCYIATASDGTYTVMVNGNIDIIINGNPSLIGIVVPVVIVITMILVVTVIPIIFIVLVLRHRHKPNPDAELPNVKLVKIDKSFKDEKGLTDDNLPHLNLKDIDENEWDLIKYDVDSDCSMKEFIEKQGHVFTRGCAFYEFNNEVESISEDQQLIIFANETKQYFGLDTDLKKLCLIGETVLRPSLSKYKVFVQSTGLGARHLASGSAVLYMKLKSHPLWNVDPTQFVELQIRKNCTLQAFCREHQLDPTKNSIYIECEMFQKLRKIEDVILMDKTSMKLFTGPNAHIMIKKEDGDVIKRHWIVFLWSTFDKKFQLMKGKKVLYKLQEQDREKQQCNLELQQPQHCSTKPPLLRINSEWFRTRVLDRNYTLKEFRSLPSVNVDPNVGKIFVEVGWIKLDGLTIHDMILMHKDTREFYTGPSAWDEVKTDYSSSSEENCAGKKEFKAFVLCDFDDNLLILKNATIFYHVHKKLRQAEGLAPIHSKHLKELKIERGCKVGIFHKNHGLSREEHEYMFVERTHFDRAEHINDVILIEKVSNKLFTYPCARHVVHKCLTDDEGKIREEIQEQWRVFAACKPTKESMFKEDTSVLCQDPKYYLEHFYVLKVGKESNNVRMSEFISKKVGPFENGKAFYEFKQPEDLPCYKEVVHVPTSVFISTEQSNTELPRCKSFASINLFYEIPGAPGYEVRPPPSSVNRVFIQCTSQGSRCLKTGMVILCKIPQSRNTVALES